MNSGTQTTQPKKSTSVTRGSSSSKKKRNGQQIHLSFAEYRQHSAVSQSDTKLALETPLLYWQKRVAGLVSDGDPPTSQQQFGIDAEAVIRSRGLPSGWVRIPSTALDRAGRRSGSCWREFRDSYPSGAILKTDAEMDSGFGRGGCYSLILKNISDHRAARTLLWSRRSREWNVQILWDCPRTGLKRKAEIDLVLWRCGIIVDLKTAADPTPSAWPWAVRRWGYDIQAATYLEAIRELTGKSEWRFGFIVIRNAPPYDVWVYEDTPLWLEAAQREADAAVDYYVKLQSSGQWFPPGWGESIKMEPMTRDSTYAF